MKHGITRLQHCCLNLVILTSLALAWNRNEQMNSSDNVTLCWLPASGIIWNMSWLLKSHMANAHSVNCLMVGQWGIPYFDHSITQRTSINTQSCWRTIILMVCPLKVSTQSATSFGNQLSSMHINFCIPMNCISSSWVLLKTHWTGC